MQLPENESIRQSPTIPETKTPGDYTNYENLLGDLYELGQNQSPLPDALLPFLKETIDQALAISPEGIHKERIKGNTQGEDAVRDANLNSQRRIRENSDTGLFALLASTDIGLKNLHFQKVFRHDLKSWDRIKMNLRPIYEILDYYGILHINADIKLSFMPKDYPMKVLPPSVIEELKIATAKDIFERHGEVFSYPKARKPSIKDFVREGYTNNLLENVPVEPGTIETSMEEGLILVIDLEPDGYKERELFLSLQQNRDNPLLTIGALLNLHPAEYAKLNDIDPTLLAKILTRFFITKSRINEMSDIDPDEPYEYNPEDNAARELNQFIANKLI